MSDVRPNPRITQYDAPESKPDCFVRRVLFIPVDDDYRVVAAVNDVLGWLTRPDVFNPSDEVSDVDMQALMTEMWLGYFGELEIMIGAVVPMATDVLPAFMVWCEGQTLLRSAYPELYGRLHPNFIVDADSFIVPDMRSRMPFGFEIGEGIMGETGGAVAVAITEAQMPTHFHLTHSHLEGLAVAPGELPVSLPGLVSEGTGTAGGGLPHDNMPPYVILRFAMVAKWRDCC
jgi:microcystin-dependent protein